MGKRVRGKSDYPIVKELIRDWKVKARLEKNFDGFYKRLTKAIKANPGLKNLEVPLEKVREDVDRASFGPIFGLIGPIADPRKAKKR